MSLAIASPGAALPPTDQTLRDPFRANQHIFRILLDALANPGTERQLIAHPQASSDNLDDPWIASVLATMLDHEVSLHIASGDDSGRLREFVSRRTRVAFVPAPEADFVVVDTSMPPSLPEAMKRGSLEFPDDGATLVITGVAFKASTGNALTLGLNGPGIPGTRTLHISGLSPEMIASRNRAIANYPTGIDLLLIDNAGTVVGIPRTTTIALTSEGGH